MGRNYKNFLLAGLSGLLLSLTYPGWNFGVGSGPSGGLSFLIWVGFLPLFFAFARVKSEDSNKFSKKLLLKRFFVLGFITGLIYFSIIFRWLWAIYPLDTIGIESRIISFITTISVWLIATIEMAIFWGIFGLAIAWSYLFFYKSPRGEREISANAAPTVNLSFFLAVPAVFVLIEYLRSLVFGIFWLGSGTLWGAHWTIGSLAYSLTDNFLSLRLVSFFGIYGLNFLIVLVNIFILKFIVTAKGWISRILSALVVISLFSFVIPFLYDKLASRIGSDPGDSRSLDFAVIQTSIPTKLWPSSEETLAGLKEQLELIDRVAKDNPNSQLIIFPESSDFFKNIALFLTPAQVREYFENLFDGPKLAIAGGRILDTDGQTYSRAFDLDTKDGVINYYDKRLLTPGGEFLPYPIRLLSLLVSKTTTSRFDNLREINVGLKDVSTVNFRDQFLVSPIICSELLSPGLTREVSQNSDIITSMASYGIFHGDKTIAKEMLAATRLRAAENGKPIITAANMGRSHVIDYQGNVVYLAKTNNPQILTGAVEIRNRKTWYNRIGDHPVILGSLVLVLILNIRALIKIKWKLF